MYEQMKKLNYSFALTYRKLSICNWRQHMIDSKHEITCILTWKGKEPAHICEQVLNFHLLDATFLRDTR